MDIIKSKIISILVIGIGSMFSGLLPAYFTSREELIRPLILSSLLCFGGGVLLSTSIVHILPELRRNTQNDYVEIVFCAGFFLIYLLDEIVHYFYGESHHNNYEVVQHQNPRRHSLTTDNNGCYGSVSEHQRLLGNNRSNSDSVLFNIDHNNVVPSQLCHVGHQEPCHSSATVSTTNIGLLFALSVHSLLEGLVIGLEHVPSKVFLLLGAVLSHKLVVGFCLGAELSANNSYTTFCRHFLCIFIFTIGSVAGILVGLFIPNTDNTSQYEYNNLTILFMQALAGGTLLYVTVSEIIPRERARWHQQHNKKSAGIIQLISVVSGFLVMTVVSKYLDYD